MCLALPSRAVAASFRRACREGACLYDLDRVRRALSQVFSVQDADTKLPSFCIETQTLAPHRYAQLMSVIEKSAVQFLAATTAIAGGNTTAAAGGTLPVSGSFYNVAILAEAGSALNLLGDKAKASAPPTPRSARSGTLADLDLGASVVEIEDEPPTPRSSAGPAAVAVDGPTPRAGQDDARAAMGRIKEQVHELVKPVAQNVGAEPPADAHRRGRRAASTGLSKFQPYTLVIDLTFVIDTILAVFLEQQDEDRRAMEIMYDEFDEDKNGVLSLPEFNNLLAACVRKQDCTERVVMRLFAYMQRLEKRFAKKRGGKSTSADSDSVSPGAFAQMCSECGLTPPVRYRMAAEQAVAQAPALAAAALAEAAMAEPGAPAEGGTSAPAADEEEAHTSNAGAPAAASAAGDGDGEAPGA